MKKPQQPPNHWAIWAQLPDDRRGLVIGTQMSGNKYLHWDEMRHRQPPAGLTHEEWWLATKLHRSAQSRPIPHKDVDGRSFSFTLADPIPEHLHDIDKGAAGSISMPDAITNPETKDRYLISSLVEEAITSSQLEGAATTRLVAKELIRTGRAPRDRSERMILNNYRTMQRIGKIQRKKLTEELVLEIHRLVTSETLDEPSAAGRFRRTDESIDVGDLYGEVFHVPPPAEELPGRMAAMCAFANDEARGQFVHPVVRSIILHFWLAYDHPFVDGNGRTARALFYWSMLHRGFWLCEFISISDIILKGPAKYGRAFLHTETDANDLTYFLIYHLDVLRRAIKGLHAYVTRKTKQLRTLERELRGLAILNHRQRALMSHALRHPHYRYTIESHRASHNVVYQTARTDLLDLVDRTLLTNRKVGKTWHFSPPEDLEQRLTELA